MTKHQLTLEAMNQIKNADILVNIISRRVRQLGQGFRPLIEVHPRWSFMEIALREIGEGKLAYEALEQGTKLEKPSRRRSRSTAVAAA